MESHVPKRKKVFVTIHPHYLLLSGKEDRYNGKNEGYIWYCDSCQIKACDSVYSFHCKSCGYDVCSRCFEKYYDAKKKEDCCLIF